jgi:uncharacterized repeat protein (TIGR01451 family)
MAKRNIGKTMQSIYGTGSFNPRSFERRPRRSTGRLYLWGLGLFLFSLIAVLFIGLYLFGGSQDSFTGERVDISLVGSQTPQASENETYTLRITNNEEVLLEELELFINWPENVHYIGSELEPTSEANNTWQLGALGVGEEISFGFTARFVGDERSVAQLLFALTVKPDGFSSTFEITESIEFQLSAAPIEVNLQAPSTAASESNIELSITVESEAFFEKEKNKLSIILNYGEGFNPEVEGTSDITTTDSSVLWKLSSLEQIGDAYTVLLSGKLTGDVSSKHNFIAGLVRGEDTDPFITDEKVITIQSAEVGIDIIPKPASGKKLQWGERLDYTITITNTGSYVMRNVVISADIPNENLWKSGTLIIGNDGFFESGNVFWDTTTTGALDSVRPKNNVLLTLSLTARDVPPKGIVGAPQMEMSVSVSTKLGDQDITVESPEVATNILADIDFEVFGQHKSGEGVALGAGPHPPLAGEETTYAMVWQIGPTSSALVDLELRAKLPSGVLWKDDSKYSVGELSHESSTRTVVWKASKVPRLELPIEILFMVGITPSSQLSNSHMLLERTEFRVVDEPTGEAMELFNNGITLGGIE